MVYKEILEERASALLMDEDTMNFYQHELKIFPRKNVLYAVSYIMKLLGILLKQKENKELYYKDVLKAMKKQLERFGIKGQELKNAEKCEAIIAEFNRSGWLKAEEEFEERDDARSHTQEFREKLRN